MKSLLAGLVSTYHNIHYTGQAWRIYMSRDICQCQALWNGHLMHLDLDIIVYRNDFTSEATNARHKQFLEILLLNMYCHGISVCRQMLLRVRR